MVVCSRCGVVNRSGRIACVQCMARLDPAGDLGTAPLCANHPDLAATGRCVTCGMLVCDQCGGVINNRSVYCVDHSVAAMAGDTVAAGGGGAPKKKGFGRKKG